MTRSEHPRGGSAAPLSGGVLLASQSPYRRQLLARLLPEFATAAPAVDETRRDAEPPAALAVRLARAKAEAGQRLAPASIVIGSDQVATLGALTLGKPGTVSRAVEQLLQCSGQSVEFLTAVCILCPGRPAGVSHLDITRVRFRTFERAEAERYVAADQPLDCAGSFKAEARGVALMERLDSSDPTAIQGLPLIWVANTLRELGVSLY